MGVAESRMATITARLALTPIAVGIWLAGEEPSDPTSALPAQKGKEAPRRQSGTARLEDIVTRRTKAVNPVSRDVAADCLRRADGPPTQGERRAPARAILSAAAADFPLVKNGH
jgi:hypothetical protein